MSQVVHVDVVVMNNGPRKKQLRFYTSVPLSVEEFWDEGAPTKVTNTFVASGVKTPSEQLIGTIHETYLFPEYDGKITYLEIAGIRYSMTAHLELLSRAFPDVKFEYDLSQVPEGFFDEP